MTECQDWFCTHGCEHACKSTECLDEINEPGTGELDVLCRACNNPIGVPRESNKSNLDTGVLPSKYKIGVGLEGPGVGTSWLVPGDYAVNGAIGTNTTAVIAPG